MSSKSPISLKWTYEKPGHRTQPKAWESMVVEFVIDKPTSNSIKSINSSQLHKPTNTFVSKMDLAFVLN